MAHFKDTHRYRVKPGSKIVPRGRCPSCGFVTTVSNKMWYRASRPRCSACGDFLVPGTAHNAIHYDLQDRGLMTAADTERLAFTRQLPSTRRHNCFINGCREKSITQYALCRRHTVALKAIDKRLYGRIQGRYVVFHGVRWKVRTKALSLWNILIASASHKLKLTELSSSNTLTPDEK